MTHKNYMNASGWIFAIIALVHLARTIYGWSAVVNGWQVPLWVSWIAIIVAGYLAYNAFRLGKRA